MDEEPRGPGPATAHSTTSSAKAKIARRIAIAVREEGLTKSALARRMRTSRSSLDRLLDPTNPSVTLATLEKAAGALGRRLRLDLE